MCSSFLPSCSQRPRTKGMKPIRFPLKRAVNALACLLAPAIILSAVIIQYPEKSLDTPRKYRPVYAGKKGCSDPTCSLSNSFPWCFLRPMAGAVLVVWRKRGRKMTDLTLFQLVGLFLLCTGVFGLIRRKTLVGNVHCHGTDDQRRRTFHGGGRPNSPKGMPSLGQLGALFVMGLAAAEATLILAIILVVVKRFKSGQTDRISQMKG